MPRALLALPGLLEWRECTRLIDRSTDVVWNCVLPELRRQVPKRNTVAGNPVHCVGNAELSEAAQQVLSCGPKFAMAPRQTRQEQLAMVRQVAGKAPESEFDLAEVLLKGSRSGSAAASGGNDARFRPEKVLVIPYVHTVSHNLRKLGRKVGVDVLFSAPPDFASKCAIN
ncbi:hypothetical protein HPB52_006832 [Rhipicephalus sanguineus]|uniref:Uncharacterized protein n=1 Tax=Rhipicephalus sanguineus TaxID=34632 RepID=A0A9D4PJM8_RHISA|nr:hypothetical protein HPB52_006832 [Rhipicephalus sanguineus]